MCAPLLNKFFCQSGTFFDVFSLLVKVIQVSIPRYRSEAFREGLGRRIWFIAGSKFGGDLLVIMKRMKGVSKIKMTRLFDIVRRVEQWYDHPINSGHHDDVLKDRIVSQCFSFSGASDD